MKIFPTAAAAMIASWASLATAEEFSISAVMVPQESIRLDFQDGSNQFVLMVRREGTAEGDGPLAGASVTEYGWHDINPPHDGDPLGYLELVTPAGDYAYIRWTVRAVFFAGDDRPRLADYGHWELVSGTGALEGMTGVGTLTISAVSPTDRLFALTGEIAPRP